MRRLAPLSTYRAWLFLAPALFFSGPPALPAEVSEVAESGAATTEELEEIVIQSHEPRYVAPTRRDRIGRVWVPVMINEKGPYRLVLDSGATHSAVTEKVAISLGISLSKFPPVMLRGVTGSAVTPSIHVDSLTVGELLVGASVLPIVEDAFGGAQGLLGTEGMQDKRIYIDFINDFINIGRSRNRGPAAGFTAIPLQRDAGRLLMVRGRVSGIRVRAIIDTGAQSTIGNVALKQKLDQQWSRRRQSTDIITGATGASQVGLGMPIAAIDIGGIKISTAHITFGDMVIFDHWKLKEEPAIMIGMDILGLVDTLIIDYYRQELQIKPIDDNRLRRFNIQGNRYDFAP
ncbi:MAG TPA: aspartyl protease family protein [Steroidobacteraceae bacterium]|nr:aspartyl protease family protein [Steroidobacteraceae bacterium]